MISSMLQVSFSGTPLSTWRRQPGLLPSRLLPCLAEAFFKQATHGAQEAETQQEPNTIIPSQLTEADHAHELLGIEKATSHVDVR